MKLKGNLHVHTTRSDGRKTPEQCIKLYKENGYDFLAITDHFKFFPDADKYCDDNFTVLNGCEMNFDLTFPNKSRHIVCIGNQSKFTPDRSGDPNEATKLIKDNGGIAILAHPSWSLLSFKDVMEMKNIAGVEIWNHISYAYTSRGGSENYVDVCAASGLRPLLFAVDDTHFYDKDVFGGYIVLDSPSNTKKDIMESIKAGNFYCSQGPEINSVIKKGNIITVETSPVQQIVFLSDALWVKDRVREKKDKLLTKASYEIKPNETFVRIECMDSENKKAWSQIIDIKQ